MTFGFATPRNMHGVEPRRRGHPLRLVVSHCVRILTSEAGPVFMGSSTALKPVLTVTFHLWDWLIVGFRRNVLRNGPADASCFVLTE